MLSVDLSGHTDRKYFSLAVYSPEGAIIYAVQDKMPESSVYNLSVPYDKAVENPDIENLCSISVKIQLNGQETTIPAEAHTFEEKVVSPTKTEEGYTEHTCKACGYTFRDAETEPIGYFVTYDANGGGQAPEKQNKRPAEALAISDEIPSREGYTFIGWSSDKDSESPEYEIGAEYTADEDITLYAIWRVNTYKLIYTVDGNEYKTVEASFGDRITAEKAPSKNGYTFSGWSKLSETMPANDVTVSGTFTKKSSGVGGGGGDGGSENICSVRKVRLLLPYWRDEFCVIMYRQLNRIDELNNKFKHALEQLRKGVGSFFGVSVGYAYYDEKKADIQAVIEEADEMMYQNKHENI